MLETRLRRLFSDLGAVLVLLKLTGTLSVAGREAFESRIGRGLGSMLLVLRQDNAALLPRPTAADLEAINRARFFRGAAETHARRVADATDPDQALAVAALQRLYVSHMPVGRSVA